MQQLLLVKPGELVLRQVDIPKAGPGELVIKIKATITCGTDLKTFRRGHPKWPMPMPMGHEFSGDVYEVGSGVTDFKVGQPVFIAPTAPCGTCRHCQRGYGNLCDFTLGTMILGSFSEYVKIHAHIVRTNVFPKPENLSYLEAAVLEPLSCVVYGDEHLRVKPHHTVVIIGAGPIGLLHTMVTKLHNPKKVIVVGRREMRLKAAREMGADVVIDEAQEDTFEAIMRHTDGRGADVVIECTGYPNVWEKAITLARPGGQVMLFGGCAKGTSINMPMERIVRDGLNVQGVFHFTPSAVRHSKDLLTSGQIKVSKLITDMMPLTQYKEIFRKLCDGDAIKIGIDVNH